MLAIGRSVEGDLDQVVLLLLRGVGDLAAVRGHCGARLAPVRRRERLDRTRLRVGPVEVHPGRPGERVGPEHDVTAVRHPVEREGLHQGVEAQHPPRSPVRERDDPELADVERHRGLLVQRLHVPEGELRAVGREAQVAVGIAACRRGAAARSAAARPPAATRPRASGRSRRARSPRAGRRASCRRATGRRGDVAQHDARRAARRAHAPQALVAGGLRQEVDVRAVGRPERLAAVARASA